MKIRKFILFILAAICFEAAVQAQTKQDEIKRIQKCFQEINADTTLKTVSLENEKFTGHPTDGGGKLTGFFKQDSIEKISEWIGLSNGNWIRTYYFKDNKLIFVYERFEFFVENNKTKATFEGWYYFNNNRIVKQEIFGNRIYENNQQDILKELLSRAEEDIKLLTRKK